MGPILAFALVLLAFQGYEAAEPVLDALSVTWGIPGGPKKVFDKLPLTSDDAEEEGWLAINSFCLHPTRPGFRYMKYNEPAVILIYDIEGNIAGFQTALKDEDIKKVPQAGKYFENRIFHKDDIEDIEIRTLTAYIVNPALICLPFLQRQLELSFQNGTLAHDHVNVPTKETELGTHWTKGACLSTMGQHYWYDAPVDMDCSTFQPPFLLFDKGTLSGFGFVFYGNFTSLRYEHIQIPLLGAVFQDVPNCLPDKLGKTRGASSIHVFFNKNPEQQMCPEAPTTPQQLQLESRPPHRPKPQLYLQVPHQPKLQI